MKAPIVAPQEVVAAKEFTAELLGTFCLLFFGVGAIMSDSMGYTTFGNAGIALVFGVIVSIIIYSLGPVSGAHLNPAVTLAFTLNKSLKPVQLAYYWAAQIVGAIIAMALLGFLFPDASTYGQVEYQVSTSLGISLEIFLTFFLVFVILRTATGPKNLQVFCGLIVGLTVFLGAVFGGPLTGAAMNPARYLAPAIWASDLSLFPHYWVSGLAGGALAFGAWKFFYQKTTNE